LQTYLAAASRAAQDDKRGWGTQRASFLFLAVQHLHLPLVVAASRHGLGWNRRLNRRNLIGTEFDGQRAQALSQLRLLRWQLLRYVPKLPTQRKKSLSCSCLSK
jgi:hypothetical protein